MFPAVSFATPTRYVAAVISNPVAGVGSRGGLRRPKINLGSVRFARAAWVLPFVKPATERHGRMTLLLAGIRLKLRRERGCRMLGKSSFLLVQSDPLS